VDLGNPRDQPATAIDAFTILQGTETRQDKGETKSAVPQLGHGASSH